MAKKLTLIGGSGLSGNGKTTQLDLMAVTLDASHPKGRIMRAEMSTVIKWGAGQHGRIADQINDCQQLMRSGGYLPDEVTIPLLKIWIGRAVMQNDNLQTLLFGGIPRTDKQKAALKEIFETVMILDLLIDPNEAQRAIAERSKKSAREDDRGGIIVFEKRKLEWENHTVPMLNSCNGERVVLDRSKSPEVRLRQAFEHARNMKAPVPVLPHSLTKKALNRLRSGTHRVHTEIKNIIAGKGITPGIIAYQTV